MKETLKKYIKKTDELLNSLAPLSETKSIFPKVHALRIEMQDSLEKCTDEMLYPAVYNAAATIASAPEGCSVRQLTEALCDAKAEMEMMLEYM